MEKIFFSIPNHRQEIEFQEEFTKTFNGEDFLLYDSGPEENHILIFSTRRNLQLLSQRDHWYADGTFKTVPLLFNRLYTIHGLKEDASVSLLYALLPNRTKETYEHLLKQLKILQPVLSPRTITVDFEKPMITALRNEFPDARLRGCLFHFTQCILRDVKSKGLKQRQETDVEFALKLRMLPAVAFVPTESVVEVFETLSENEIFPPEAQEVVDYFEDTWIGRPHRRQRRPPQFDLNMWSLYQSILEDLSKTNNSVEGWHRGFTERVSAMHPNIWKFNYIKKEQSLNEIRIGNM
ncbi:MULE transposase domain [Popillia japonica]|uniref:MULE transposase domain n=1 Tax=Popillia japonica TaxID=7064 RepID=A0AAW1KEY9_POPJA